MKITKALNILLRQQAPSTIPAYFVNAIIDDETGEASAYKYLIFNDKDKATWEIIMYDELVRMAQVTADGEKGTYTIFSSTNIKFQKTEKWHVFE